ncbi:hypothetical protein KL938_004898 [Ogataea parapolymorpha]|nr:hypothetical protein KL938_004898 [Ogataea parapolymorpha]
MEAFRLPRKSRPALSASSDGKSPHEQHNDGTLFVSKGVKYYLPVLFYTAPAITKAPFPMLICDVLKLRDCRRVYKNEGYAPASQNILMLGNHPVQKILVQGKVVGERWHEMSQDKFFMFLEISDGTAENALTVKIQSQLYHQRLNGFEKNSNLLVQVRGVANVYNDQVEICAEWLDVVGDKRDMGVEMDWWDRALSMKAEVLEDPWEYRGDVDEAKKNGEKLLKEWQEERRAAKEEDERLVLQLKREKAYERQQNLENERAKADFATEADVANGQAADSAEHDSEGSGYATATEIEESDEANEVYEDTREASSDVEQEEVVIGEEEEVREEKGEEEQPVKKRRKKEPKAPQTDEQTSANAQFLLPPPAFVGTRVSISLLGHFDDDHNAVEKEILRFCLQTTDSKFSLDRLMADRLVAVSVYQEILRTRAEQDSEPLNSDLDQHSFKLFFHAARKSLCHTKLLKLTKSSNIETNSLKNVQEYFLNLINHVMHQMKIVIQELKDDSDNVEEFCRNMVQFYHTRLGRFVLTSRSMVSKVQDKFSVSITAPMIRQIMAHTICSAETDHSIELEDGLQINFTWYYLVKHCHYMYLPEIVHSGK